MDQHSIELTMPQHRKGVRMASTAQSQEITQTAGWYRSRYGTP
jgi:hypothetical protein